MGMRHRSIGLRVGLLIAVPVVSLALVLIFVASITLSNGLTHAVRLQLILAGGLGLAGLIATVALSLMLGRGLVRQLRDVQQSALTLAHRTLPGIIDRLRSGEAVDLDQYAPTKFPTRSEIEQVGQAVSVLQQAAIQSAADEARLRRGISDVFRNLAGRSQSLLHRQLALIDAMERRTTDPDELERLFRIDHLTTRMRRHAEGLIILSGATPGRGWRRPVPLIDVLRAAVAEVEDYTRVRVQCRTGGAVAGHAVADIVHLLAELAENATVFSPPNSPVRMQGDSVDQGFVIEIEDRGLGISRTRLEEINVRLANPPKFDLSGSDRLGLLIAGQLARRHDVTVTLRPSVYGGTTAVVHLPNPLVADEEAAQPDRGRPADPEGAFHLGRAAGRHSALAAIAATNGHRTSGGFSFGRLAEAGDDASDATTAGENLVSGSPVSGTAVSDTAVSNTAVSNTAVSETAAEPSLPATELTEPGLPVRVRQASIAPQLRDSPPASDLTLPRRTARAASSSPAGDLTLPRRTARTARAADGAAEPGPAGDLTLPRRTARTARAADGPAEPGLASPEAARSMVSALQRGWELGRTDPAHETTGPAPAEAGGDADDHDEN